MADSEAQARYRDDAKVLAAIGAHLADQDLPEVEVQLPSALARAAIAAWERDEIGPTKPEDTDQAAQRNAAATLALIGLSITERGRWDGDEVVVPLWVGFVGDALNAANATPDEGR
jgi:hypothetical protein